MQNNWFDTIYIGFSGLTMVEFAQFIPDINIKTAGQIIILTLTCAKLYYPEIKKYINKKRKK